MSNKKKKKRSDINSDEIKSSSDNNEHVKLESTDHNINGVENDNIVVNRLGQKIIKRLNYFWGNVQRNSTKVKYESASKKSSFVIREEKIRYVYFNTIIILLLTYIRQSLIKLFQLQYERELKEKEEKASNRMTRRLLALILHEKKNAPDNKTNNASQSITLFPSIFQKRK